MVDVNRILPFRVLDTMTKVPSDELALLAAWCISQYKSFAPFTFSRTLVCDLQQLVIGGNIN